jgi:hypothetical protein
LGLIFQSTKLEIIATYDTNREDGVQAEFAHGEGGYKSTKELMNRGILLDREEAKVATICSYDRMTCPAGDKTTNISSLNIGLHLDHSRSP